MKSLHMKIPTRHGEWIVALEMGGFAFYCNGQGWSVGATPPPIPKTVLRRARCFILNPERFGIRKSF